MYKEIPQCLVCGSDLTEVVDLGVQYVVDFVKEKDEKLLKAPLTLMLCNYCSLVQLKHRVNPDRLYKKFWYRSGMNEQMSDELLAIVQKAEKAVALEKGDRVLDIGCNDGTLLGWYTKGTVTVGIDPCANLVAEGMANKKIDVGIFDYFSVEAVTDAFNSMTIQTPRFKVITAVAMFYDVETPVAFLRDCGTLLHKEGVLVIQMNYLHTMLAMTAFDNICHEHLTYYSLLSLNKAVEKAGLTIQGVELSKSNGGSVRVYITHPKFDRFYESDNQQKLWLYSNFQMKMIEEMKAGMDTPTIYQHFQKAIDAKMERVRTYIDLVIAEKHPMYVYGASTRGTVLLQYLYKDRECPLIAAAERDEHKFGLKMVGTWTPIVSEKEARKNCKHMLVLPWHFQESILKREHEWINVDGGTLLFPLPTPRITSPLGIEEYAQMLHSKAI